MGNCCVKIGDEILREYVIAALELRGIRCVDEISAGDAVCCCEDGIPSLDDGMKVVILYRRPRYTRSPAYAALSERCRCRAVERPFLLEDLVTAVEELLCGEENGAFAGHEEEKVLILHREDLCAEYGGCTMRFTEREYRLLEALAEKAGSPVSREKLLAEAWDGLESRGNVVDVYVGYLRKKLEPVLGKGVILSVRGKGYALEPGDKILRIR